MKPTQFTNASEAVAIATYVEQMLTAEQQWIMNRLNWLFTSQSFLIAAFVVLITNTTPQDSTTIVLLLKVALPIIGLLSCILVGASVQAAERVGGLLGDERGRLSKCINELSASQIPLIGTGRMLRAPYWTLPVGALPHRILPWIIALLWLALFFAVIV